MDFFQRQADARRLSVRLSLYFILALISMLLIVNLVPFLVLNHWFYRIPRSVEDWMGCEGLVISAITLSTFIHGNWSRARTIRRGGDHLAAAAGGQFVQPGAAAPEIVRLVHVVEEMSIASGLLPPRLYVMTRETGLNAFVAGLDRDDAVLVVTRGLVEALNRDELQAVVAHEFSHIVHDDMKLNSRMLILLGGMMMLGSAGRSLMSFEGHDSWFGRSRRGDVRLFPLGLLMWLVGALGTMAGRIIQAAICRQREYLADAASVQYTRQTTGLASALHKLMVASEGTGLRHAALAGELNHMCIGESLASHRWLASHPPLQARITAIDSGFLRAVRIRKNQGVLAKRRAARKGTVGMATVAGGDTEDAMVNPHVSARVGHWGRRELAWAGTVREALVERYGQALDDPAAAAELLLALIRGRFEYRQAESPGPAALLPLLEWLTSTVRQLPAAARETLVGQLGEAARDAPDHGLTMVCCLMYLNHHLDPRLRRSESRVVRRYEHVQRELAALLSLFCRLGSPRSLLASKDEQSGSPAGRLFATIADQWFPLTPLIFQPRSTASGLELALHHLSQLPPLLKPALIDACAIAVTHDGEIAVAEYELLRVSCELLGCPLPPQIDRDYAPAFTRPPLRFDTDIRGTSAHDR